MARRLGATPEQIGALAANDVSAFPVPWRAALAAAAEMTRGGGRVDAALYAELAEHWHAEQIVEIVAVIGLFNYFNRFANALDIPPTK